MILTLTEIQITCAVLMVLVSQLLLFATPRLTHSDAVLNHSRKLLGTGTLLVALHFFLQYILHKNHLIDASQRTTLNLAFGLPFAYCFNISLLYLQRKGEISRKEYTRFHAICYVSLVSLIASQIASRWMPLMHHLGNLMMALCATATQLYANYLQIKEYRHMRRYLKNGGIDQEYPKIIKWTRGSMFFMAATGVILPIMVFIPNIALRGMYGILSLSAGHFYVFSFLGYLIQRVYPKKEQYVADTVERLSEEWNTDTRKRNDSIKIEQISVKLPELESSLIYLKPGLTQGHLAEILGVSPHVLAHYFQNTPYCKFTNWMQQKRIEHAKRLLHEHPDWSNQTISQACGYSSRSYFQSQFMDVTGMSPSQWADEHV